MERLSWTTRWAQCNHQSSLKRKAGESESEGDDGRMEAEVRERRCSVACFEDGGGPQAKECEWPLERQGRGFSPTTSR